MKNHRAEKKLISRKQSLFLKNSAVVCLSFALLACNSKNKAPGQSVARVNNDEITISQLNEEMQRLGSQQVVGSKLSFRGFDRPSVVIVASHQ